MAAKASRPSIRPDDFHELFHRVTAEARAAFGNGDVYLEKYVTSLRHIEAQLLRDVHGNSKVLGLRDCSVQRDKQKILEESDSTMLPEELRRRSAATHRRDRRRSRLRRRRHRRVHLRSEIERRVLHGDEHAAAGRASGDGTGLRRRHRRRTVPHRIRRKHRETRDRAPRLCDRSAHQRGAHRGRRGRQTAVPSRPGPDPAVRSAAGRGHRDHRDRGAGQVRFAVLRQHGRAGHRARHESARHDRQALEVPRTRAHFRYLHEHLAAEDDSLGRSVPRWRLRHELPARFPRRGSTRTR